VNKVPEGTERVRAFLPCRDFDLSKRFYEALGFQKVLDSEVAIFNAGSGGFILQRYFQKEWAENTMLQFMVDDLDAWWEHISGLDLPGQFGVQPPKAPVEAALGPEGGIRVRSIRRSLACVPASQRCSAGLTRIDLLVAAVRFTSYGQSFPRYPSGKAWSRVSVDPPRFAFWCRRPVRVRIPWLSLPKGVYLPNCSYGVLAESQPARCMTRAEYKAAKEKTRQSREDAKQSSGKEVDPRYKDWIP
jgi:hypothetical protein